MKRARLIYNPSSGREEVRSKLPLILETFEKMGYHTSAFATKKKDDALEEAQRACQKGFDLIIAAGGDGTIYEVINGMAGEERRARLAILPTGTTNDFARAIGVPRNIEEALEVIKQEYVCAVDVGKMNDKYFINIAGGGSLTELTYEVPAKLKTVIGPLAYYLKGMEKIALQKPFKADIVVDGAKSEEELLLFLVSNTNSVGGFEKIAPLAEFTDGALDVLLIKKCNITEIGRIMTLMLTGDHLQDPNVISFKTNKIEIYPKEEIQINLDGELGGYSPCHFEVLEKHIDIIVNKKIQLNKTSNVENTKRLN